MKYFKLNKIKYNIIFVNKYLLKSNFDKINDSTIKLSITIRLI